jgi:hypothetical protein
MVRRVYTKDVLSLFDKVDLWSKEDGRTKLVKDKYKRMNNYMALILQELKSSKNQKKPSKTITAIPENTISKKYRDLTGDSVGEECSGNVNITLDPLSWVIEGRPYLERFRLYPGENDEVDNYNEPLRFARFPIVNPAFPATSSQRLKLDGFKEFNLENYTNIFVKDESQNPTGTHKDRMALEVLNWYEQKERANFEGHKRNPNLSLLSYGCAALAIQSILGINKRIQEYSFSKTNLRVLLPDNIDPGIENALSNIGADVYKVDLTKENLTSKRILELTENTMSNSYDLTFGNSYDCEEKINLKEDYYNYMSWEIINTNSKYIFLPFGSGDLYYNVLKRMYDNVLGNGLTPTCMHIKPEELLKLNLIGCTVFNNPNKKNDKVIRTFDKLYSPYYGDNNNKELSDRIISEKILNNGCSIKILDENHLNLIPLATKIMIKNNIDFELSGLSSMLMFLSRINDLSIKPKDKVLIVNTGKLKYEQFLEK